MHKLRELLPSANCLFTFEAAARHESFTDAAAELNLTQPSVSRAVQQLEGWLGVKLFYRHHRAIELTSEGRRLYQDLGEAFEHLYLTASTLRKRSNRENLKVSFSTSFVTFCLAPRLGAFAALHPEVQLHIDVAARDDKDLVREGIDMSLRIGEGQWGALRAWRLVDEEVYPICSPGYLAHHGSVASVADLVNHRLLQIEEPYRVRIAWKEWLHHNGVTTQHLDYALTCTDAASVVEAALNGQGIALGWNFLVARKIAEGQLVRPVEASHRTGLGVYVVAPNTGPMKWSARVFRDWLLSEFKSPEKSA